MTVNDEETDQFAGEGDWLQVSARAICSCGVGDPDPEFFYQETFFCEEGEGAMLAWTADLAIVDAPGSGFTVDVVGGSVPMAGPEVYEAWVVVFRYDGMAQEITLDTEMQYFIAD